MKFKLTALLLIAALLCPIFSGCAKKNAEEVIAPREAERVTNVYRSEFLSLPEETYIDSNAISVIDGRIYVRCSRNVGNDEEYIDESYIYSFDFGGGNPEEMIIKPINEGAYINNVVMCADGSIYTVENSYDPDTYVSSYLLNRTASDGTVVFSIDPAAYFPSSDSDMYGGFYIQYMNVTSNGEIVITSNQNAVVVAADGSKLFELTFDDWIDNMGTTNDGRVYISYYDSNMRGMVSRFIDIDNKKLGDPLAIPDGIRMTGSNCSVMPGEGYDMYIRDDNAVYGYNNADTEPTKLLDYINSDIIPDGIRSFYVIDADHFLYNGYDNVTFTSIFAFLTRVPDEEVEPKMLINLSYVYSDYMLSSYVVKFNQTNDTYRVVLHDYSTLNTEDNYELGGQTLTNEIIAGNVPDILSLGSYSPGLDGDSLMEKGLFCDLYEFIDKQTDMTRDDLLKCARTPFEYDGKLTQLVTGFYISTLTGKTANVGSASSWTIEQLLALRDSLPEGATLFGNKYMTKSYMLSNLLTLGYSEFIDEQTLTCSFDSDTFVKLLEYCNTFPEEFDYDNDNYDSNEDSYADYREDRVMLDYSYISSFSDYLQLKFRFGFEPINLIGYPTDSGSGAQIISRAGYSITSRSPVKEGAWEFLRFLISDEVLTGGMETRGMNTWPSTVKALDAMAAYETKYYYFFSYNGGWSTSDQPFTQERLDNMGEQGLEGHLEQSDIDEVKAYLDSITVSKSADEKIMSIITEEVEPFFKGNKTAADCANVIQSKVSIYINEIS